MLAIALIVATSYLFTTTQKNRKIALAKGIKEDDLTIFSVTLWLYVLPPIFSFLFSELFDVIVAAILIILYVPGLVMSRKLSVKLGTGFDFERKAGREYDKAMWLGFAGIGLVIFRFVFFILGSVSPTR